MRRWLLQFVKVWLGILGPSLFVWLLVVRWNDGGTDRFESVWRWFENLLAFPIVFRPATTPSWDALHDGSAATAFFGFVILVAVWAAMFAIPIAFVSGWYHILTRRNAEASPGRATVDDFGIDTTSRGAASGAPPLILLVTLPFALLYQGFLSLRRIRIGRVLRAFRPALIVFSVTVVLMLVIVWGAYFQAANTGAWDWGEINYNLQTYFWNGYLDTLRVPRIFDERFWHASSPPTIELFRDLRGMRWFSDAQLQTMAILIAVRTALIPTTPVAIWCLIRSIYHRFGGTST